MKNLLLRAGAIALALFPCVAAAQSTGSSVQFPAGWAPSTSVCTKQVDGTCVPVSAANPLPVSGGGGGGGGSTSTTSTAAAPTQTEGSTTNALSTDLTGYLRTRAKQDGTWSVGLTGSLPAFAATPTFNIGTAPTIAVTGAFYQATQPVSGSVSVTSTPGLTDTQLRASAFAVTAAQPDAQNSGTINTATSNAIYAVSPVNGQSTVGYSITGLTGTGGTLTLEGSNDGTNWATISGVVAGSGLTASTFTADTQFRANASGRRGLRLRVSTVGTGSATVYSTLSVAGFDPPTPLTASNKGLLPGQGIAASTRTTMTASTATALEAAGVSARIAQSIFTEAALTANVYICSTQTTACSATNYDFLIPSGATAGTIYTPVFSTTGRLYAYTTGTPVLVLNSWTAQ